MMKTQGIFVAICWSILGFSFSNCSNSAELARSTEPNNSLDSFTISRVNPPHWWEGMETDTLEVLIEGTGLETVAATGSKELLVLESIPAENDNYMMVKVLVKGAGKHDLFFSKGKKEETLSYTIKQRERQKDHAGLTASDLIYLIMPDRWANGDLDNDAISTMQQTKLDRSAMFERHGGDLQGIEQHLDYLDNLGVTALWLNPTLENNEPKESYHGYAATDLFKTDPRLGDNEDYKRLVQKMGDRNMKMVMDVVHNHWGDQHRLFQNPPFKSWFHFHEEFTRTTYRATTLLDPYAAETDKNLMSNGWFDHHMPDLNQQDEHLACYLIQNGIWWVEEMGIHGYRIDTYAYPDQGFMADWCAALLREYPKLTLFGETWVHGTPVQAYFTTNSGFSDRSTLPGVTDFQLYYAINDALSQNFGWTEGSARLYYTLAKDVIYENPYQNVVFLDNHDLSRFYSMAGEDFDKYKMGVGFLMTTRGIPMLYYGTEVLMKNYADPDGKVREDFKGGWPDDERSYFQENDRSPQEQEAFIYVQKLAQWRKANPWIGESELTQFVPKHGEYVYFRSSENKILMCAMNPTDNEISLKAKHYAEMLGGASSGKDIATGEIKSWDETITLPPKSMWILEL